MQIRKLFGRLALGLALLSPVAHGAAFQNGGIRFDVNSTATAAGTTVLTRTSKQIQVFTGSSTQTVQLPDATTLQPGYWFTISTSSTGAVAVNNNAATLLKSLTATNARFVLVSNGTAAGVWDIQSAGTPITSGNLTPGSGLVIGNGTGAVLGSGTTVGIASGFYLPTTTDQTNWNAKQAALTFTAPLNNTSNTVALSTVPISLGGTGQTAKQAAFDALAPTASRGDLIVNNGTNNVVLSSPLNGYGFMADSSTTQGYSANAFLSNEGVRNLVMQTPTFSAGAMTITIGGFTAGGTATTLTSTNSAFVNFTDPAGGAVPILQNITSNLTLTVPSGALLGTKFLKKTPLYVYAVYRGSNQVAAGVSPTIQAENQVLNSVLVSDNSQPGTALFTAAAYTGVTVRLVGTMYATEATTGTYAGTGYTYAGISSARTASSTINLGGYDLGSIGITGALWYSTSTTYVAPALNTGTPVYTARGGAVAPSGSAFAISGINVPGAGRVKVTVIGTHQGSYGTNIVTHFRMFDGTNASNEDGGFSQTYQTYNPAAPVTVFFFDYTSAQKNLTYTLQCKAASQGCGMQFATTDLASINVEYLPAGSNISGTLITASPKTLLSGSAVYNASLPTNGSCIPGNYTSYIRGAGNTTYTASAPSTVPANGTGFRIYTSGAYATADAANQPSRFDVCLGAGLDDTNWRVRFGSGAGPVGYIDTTPSAIGSASVGILKSYDKSTGILTLVQSVLGTATNLYTGENPVLASAVSGGYFEVELATNPLAAGLQTSQDMVRVTGTVGASGGSSSGDTTTNNFATIVDQRGSKVVFVPRTTTTGSYAYGTDNGMYCVSASGGSSNAANAAITVGADSYTSSAVGNIPGSYIANGIQFVAGGAAQALAWCGYLSANQKVRIQSDTTIGNSVLATFSMAKIPDPFTTTQGQSGYGGEVSAHVYVNANTAETANSNLLFSAVEYDTTGAYSLATGAFKVPANAAGHYEVSCGGFYSSVNTSYYLAKNGTKIFALANGSNATYTGGTASTAANAGDLLSVMPDTTGTAYGSASAAGVQCTFKKIN